MICRPNKRKRIGSLKTNKIEIVISIYRQKAYDEDEGIDFLWNAHIDHARYP